MNREIDPNLILDYVEGELTPEDRARVEAWMADDPHLAQRIGEMSEDRAALRSMPDEVPPHDLVDASVAQLERQMLMELDPIPQRPMAGNAASRWRIGPLLAYSGIAAVLAITCTVVYQSLQGGNAANDADVLAYEPDSDFGFADAPHRAQQQAAVADRLPSASAPAPSDEPVAEESAANQAMIPPPSQARAAKSLAAEQPRPESDDLPEMIASTSPREPRADAREYGDQASTPSPSVSGRALTLSRDDADLAPGDASVEVLTEAERQILGPPATPEPTAPRLVLRIQSADPLRARQQLEAAMAATGIQPNQLQSGRSAEQPQDEAASVTDAPSPTTAPEPSSAPAAPASLPAASLEMLAEELPPAIRLQTISERPQIEDLLRQLATAEPAESEPAASDPTSLDGFAPAAASAPAVEADSAPETRRRVADLDADLPSAARDNVAGGVAPAEGSLVTSSAAKRTEAEDQPRRDMYPADTESTWRSGLTRNEEARAEPPTAPSQNAWIPAWVSAPVPLPLEIIIEPAPLLSPGSADVLRLTVEE